MADAGGGAAASGRSGGVWWDWHLFGLWILVNGVAFIVAPLAGAALQQLAWLAAKHLVQGNRAMVVLVIAVIGAVLLGLVAGSWQWRLLRHRVPGLRRRRWVMATLVPAFAVWLLVIGPQAADVLAKGGDTLAVFREGFIQALVLGPLIGLAQAAALRGHHPVGVVVRRERDRLSPRRRAARTGYLAQPRLAASRAGGHLLPGGGVRHPRGLDALGDRGRGHHGGENKRSAAARHRWRARRRAQR